jgi:hypothetical protein
MAGFLAGLGEFAGGVSEGISREAQDRAKREAARASAEEADRKRQEDKNSKAYLAAVALGSDPNRRLMGNETALDLATRDAKTWEDAFLEDNKTKGPLGRLQAFGGEVAGALTGKTAKATAVAAGVLPEPVPAAAPPAPGSLPEKKPVGLPAPAAAAGPPAAAAAAAGPPAADAAPTEVGEVTVEGKKGRKWTPLEQAQYDLAMATRYNQKEAAFKAADKVRDIGVGEQLREIRIMPVAQLGPYMSQLSGKEIEVLPSKEGKGYDLFVDDEMVESDLDRDGIVGAARTFVDALPDKGFAMVMASHKAQRDKTKDDLEAKGKEAEIVGIQSRTGATNQAVSQSAARFDTVLGADKLTLAEKQRAFDDETVLADPTLTNALDPTTRDAFDAAMARAPKTNGNVWSSSVEETDTGKRYISTNVMEAKVKALRERYDKSPQRIKGRIGKDTVNGRTVWVVLNPVTGKPLEQRYRDFNDADDKATKIWAPYDRDPTAGPAARGGGKTVARSKDNYGIGVP